LEIDDRFKRFKAKRRQPKTESQPETQQPKTTQQQSQPQVKDKDNVAA